TRSNGSLTGDPLVLRTRSTRVRSAGQPNHALHEPPVSFASSTVSGRTVFCGCSGGNGTDGAPSIVIGNVRPRSSPPSAVISTTHGHGFGGICTAKRVPKTPRASVPTIVDDGRSQSPDP